MSSKVLLGAPPRAVGRNNRKRKMAIEVDLNVPSSDHFIDVGTSGHASAMPEVQLVQPRAAAPPVTIDVDSLDDDVVVLSSPREIAEVKNNSRRNRCRSVVGHVELESLTSHAANNCNKHQQTQTNQPIINCESYDISNRNDKTVNGNGRSLAPFSRMVVPPPSPPEPALSCPICISPLVEETSTKCGHIFCKACIQKALSVQSKCPTCRKKLTKNSLIRIYLPKTS